MSSAIDLNSPADTANLKHQQVDLSASLLAQERAALATLEAAVCSAKANNTNHFALGEDVVYVRRDELWLRRNLVDFIESELLPCSKLSLEDFWQGFTSIVKKFAPRNAELLAKRQSIQSAIDAWHENHDYSLESLDEYREFLAEIGYLTQDPAPFKVSTQDIDEEISLMAGPQLVVPLSNKRFLVNAANARWGSLRHALLASDVLEDSMDESEALNNKNKAIQDYFVKFLDGTLPLSDGSHADVLKYTFTTGHDSKLGLQCKAVLRSGKSCEFLEPARVIGFSGRHDSPSAVLLKHNRLHIELQLGAQAAISDGVLIHDLYLESALTTIMDCEDSVAAVDCDDKLQLYRNWFDLIHTRLSVTVARINAKGEKLHTEKTLASNRVFHNLQGSELSISGRSLCLIRHVALHTRTDAVLDEDGKPIPEELLDAVVTSLISKHDVMARSNSKKGSIYVVKPKLHGPAEVRYTRTLFEAIEDCVALPKNTIKIGIMDEERRTSVNLAACIYEMKERIAFINTGFLDRTGDEIHTSMRAGPMLDKGQMKHARWFEAYEKANVSVGLNCGLSSKAQIGKGMWPKPDNMAAMLKDKIAHPRSGANTAWVPSPTAATLHVLHYHYVDPFTLQKRVALDKKFLNDLLSIPLLAPSCDLDAKRLVRELEDNCQSILGYVVRWVDSGIGCSKVPNIDNVNLMEDRATLRISSQIVFNWLYHRVCSKVQIENTLRKMAVVVDQQNSGDLAYQKMSDNFEKSLAFNAARELIFAGGIQANGYTEFILMRYRRAQKKLVKHV